MCDHGHILWPRNSLRVARIGEPSSQLAVATRGQAGLPTTTLRTRTMPAGKPLQACACAEDPGALSLAFVRRLISEALENRASFLAGQKGNKTPRVGSARGRGHDSGRLVDRPM